jgi:hypothetical protein
MSDAALKHVAACTHPKVKGATRVLFEAIARLVPEGQTTTPPLTLPDLAAKARYSERTARTCRDVLVSIKEIKVHDGGRGNVARFEMLQLTSGARPLTETPLPILGRAKPPRAKKLRKTSAISSDLFDTTSAISSDVSNNVGNFFRRLAVNVGNFFRRWRQTSAISSDVAPPLAVPRTDSATTKILRSVDQNLVVVDARAREPADAFLEWFEATYPTVHAGAVCVARRDRDRPLVVELLERPQTDVAHLQAMTRHLWAVTSDGVVNSNRWWIAERVRVRNVFVLHRKADFLDREVCQTAAPSSSGRPYDEAWRAIRDRIEAKLPRHEFYKWFLPLVMVTDTGRVIEVTKRGPDGALFVSWIRKHYADLVQAAVDEVRPGSRVDVIHAWAIDAEAGERDRKSG